MSEDKWINLMDLEREPPESVEQAEPADIIDLPIAFARRNLDIFADRGKVPGECNHIKLRVRRATRLVLCDTCEAELDPFLILTQLLAWQQSELARQRINEREEKNRLDRLEKLKKEEAKLRKRLREAYGDDPVEAFKAKTLQHMADWVDAAFEKGEAEHVERLEALSTVAWALLRDDRRGIEEIMSHIPENPALEQFRRKIHAAVEEIEAREKRKRIQVVKS